jgi:non-specific serine/threonine protein kinase
MLLPAMPENSLPQPLTPLVGRVWEVASAGALLRDPQVRLLTLTGPGGVGKTRLALRIAEQTASEFAQGVIFVPLAMVRDPDMVIPTIAEALGVPSLGDQNLLRRLGEFLGDRQVLLVIDNFEQVLEAATDIAELLQPSPVLKILITSREPLRLSGEQEFPVGPLPSPNGGTRITPAGVAASDAGALFLQRARAVRPGFGLTDESAVAVAEICRRLDGLPLAIELAAARTKILSPHALLARLSDRLQILTEGPRDAPQRLQTMSAAIAWSYDLLTEAEQSFFRRLSIFSGGFGIEAATAVHDPESPQDVFELVASLVDKSLLSQVESVTGDARFVMLETIRDFGLTELVRHGEEDNARRRQADWLETMIETARPTFNTRRGMGPWLDRFEEEHDNIRSVLDWQVSAGEAVAALKLCGGLYWFWYIRGYLAEGQARIEHVLALAPDAPLEHRGRAWLGAAMMAHWQGDDDRAEPWVRQAIALSRQAGDEYGAVFGMGVLALVAEDSGRFEEAVEPLEKALELAEKGGFPPTVALIMDHLGVVAWGQGQLERAIDYWERGLAIHREVGDLWGASIALSYLGIAACELQDLASAMAMQKESLTYRWEIRNTEDVAHGLSNMAMVAVAAGAIERAARLFGAAESTHELIGNPVKEPEKTIYQRYIDKTRASMDAESFQAAWTAGRALNLETAVAEALLPIEITPAGGERRFDLTDRELEVLRLLAQGKSDRDIGEELFISTRTAQTHVSHILAKLGVSSRSAATNVAIREGIAMV